MVEVRPEQRPERVVVRAGDFEAPARVIAWDDGRDLVDVEFEDASHARVRIHHVDPKRWEAEKKKGTPWCGLRAEESDACDACRLQHRRKAWDLRAPENRKAGSRAYEGYTHGSASHPVTVTKCFRAPWGDTHYAEGQAYLYEVKYANGKGHRVTPGSLLDIAGVLAAGAYLCDGGKDCTTCWRPEPRRVKCSECGRKFVLYNKGERMPKHEHLVTCRGKAVPQ